MKKIIFAIFSVLFLSINGYALNKTPQFGISLYTYNNAMVGFYSENYDFELGMWFESGNNHQLSQYYTNFQFKSLIIPKMYLIYGVDYMLQNGNDSAGQYKYFHEFQLLAGVQYQLFPNVLLNCRVMPVQLDLFQYIGGSALTSFKFNQRTEVGVTLLF